MGKYSEVFVAFDLAKKKHAVAIAEGGRTGEVRFLGDVENSPMPIERTIKKLADRYKQLYVCLRSQADGVASTTASGQDQRLTQNHSDKGAAIIPIDAQPPRTNGFGRAAGRNDREDFRPSSIGRTRSGLREPPRP